MAHHKTQSMTELVAVWSGWDAVGLRVVGIAVWRWMSVVVSVVGVVFVFRYKHLVHRSHQWHRQWQARLLSWQAWQQGKEDPTQIHDNTRQGHPHWLHWLLLGEVVVNVRMPSFSSSCVVARHHHHHHCHWDHHHHLLFLVQPVCCACVRVAMAQGYSPHHRQQQMEGYGGEYTDQAQVAVAEREHCTKRATVARSLSPCLCARGVVCCAV